MDQFPGGVDAREIDERLIKAGFDGIVLVDVARDSRRAKAVSYRENYYSLEHHGSEPLLDSSREISADIGLFSIKVKKRLWAGEFKTSGQGFFSSGDRAIIGSITKEMVATMRQDGVI